MNHAAPKPLVTTVPEKCRVCYTCVRECPAKAIRIVNGQAEVVYERCIGCGNCIRVCTQKAKTLRSEIDRVRQLLQSDDKVAAIIAPSFPAEIGNIEFGNFVGMIRKLGFDFVNEVAFGADLVAEEYRKLVNQHNGKRYIATTCPAIINFIEKYHPSLVDNLAPIVSPMVADARVLRQMHGEDLKVVFIGPCIAKKAEGDSRHLEGDLDAIITFKELRSIFEEEKITPDQVEISDFDPPYPGLGALFPISRGILQAADIKEDLIEGRVIATDGRSNFIEAIKEFESGALDAKLLEILCCDGGCIAGAGMTCSSPLFRRRAEVSKYVRMRLDRLNFNQWHVASNRMKTLDLSRNYTAKDTRMPVPSEDELREILRRIGKESSVDELNCGACGYDTCREHAIAIHKGLAEIEMCLPYTITKLREAIEDLAESHEQLASTQQALMQSERLASMGQLAAGIAHEVNNPLGVVLLYAHIMMDEADKKSEQYQDLCTIVEQADRCKKIVSGLLNFARKNKVFFKTIDIVKLIEHSIHVFPLPETIKVAFKNNMTNPEADIDPDQITQVLTNLVSNSVAAMQGNGELTFITEEEGDRIKIKVQDTGCGIAPENMDKIFEPFYTTKQIGKGTGLGLSVTYGIIKMHRGKIDVESNADPSKGPTGTTFTITLPRRHEEI